MLDKFIDAIQQFEGYFPPCKAYPKGSLSFRNCNPGNLRYTEYTKSLGGTKGLNGFAAFKTLAAGRKALGQFLKDAAGNKLKAYKGQLTLKQFFAIYAPVTDNNSPSHYALSVAANLGVDPAILIKDLIS